MLLSKTMLSLKSVILLSFLICGQARTKKRETYHGDVVLQLTPETQKDVDFLNDLLKKKNNYELDFWTYPSQPKKSVDIHVLHRKLHQFKQILRQRKIPYSVKIRNLQRLINMERMRPRSVPFDAAFHSYSQIVHEMNRLAALNNSVARVFSLGQTYENRTIYGIKISSNFSSTNKSVFFINCGLHAREWISISTCMYVARKLVLSYRTDKRVRNLVDQFEWIIIPVINADGYEYTRTSKRLWRKNMRPNSNGCIGTDLNRNFNFKWASVGADPGLPCSDIYPGDRPFSEIETRNMAVYMYSIRRRIKAYVDLHAYGQLWMSPWGFTRYVPPTYSINRAAMIEVVLAIRRSYGTIFAFGPAAVTIYKTSGDATDWVYGVLGVVHSYGVELRPSIWRDNGFIISPDYIAPVGNEMFDGFRALADFIS